MKAYGVKKQDNACCPGHSKYSSDTYNGRLSKKAHARDTKYAHSAERSRVKQKIAQEVKYLDSNLDSNLDKVSKLIAKNSIK